MKRRDFITNSALAGTGLSLGIASAASLSSCTTENGGAKPKTVTPKEAGMFSFVDVAPDGKPLKAALIGNGGRGTGAAIQFLKAGPNLSLVAMADVFKDKQDESRALLKKEADVEVPDANCFVGFDAWRKVLDMQEVDVVLLCTPPHFFPEYFRAAVEAGKHIFIEKPGAIDPVGVRTLIAASKVAQNKGLSVVAGVQRRHQRSYWDAYMQVRNGLIGDVMHATARWDGGACWYKKRQPEWSDMEYCLRNWYNVNWLMGDVPLGYVIHNIDVVTWFLGDRPVKVSGYGGCARRTTGDMYDLFSMDYVYADNKTMLATTRQINGCSDDISEKIYGSKGLVILPEAKILDRDGNVIWQYDYEKQPVKDPYHQEHIHLVEAIRLNKPINQGEDLAYSSMIAIMGREAAYTGKTITWDEIMASDLRYGPTKYEMGSLPEYQDVKFPLPGRAL
ncbi:MAG: Gfo/Idh/MocA family oxidoreductase [Prevotellaceae bacterium]|jgi:predicted dehydrogenase|nr:Gfo/Idh/MocA family oxidoreductase [Prevotellaceae bacterium]